MRKMMLAATLMVAACSAVEDANNPGGDGSGSGGDGSGSGSGEPQACTTAMDCGPDQACDLATHECVTGALTIEATDELVDDGTLWWSNVGNPTLRGTFAGSTSAMVQAFVGSSEGVAATMSADTWSVNLPANAIPSSGVMVRIVMTDPSGGAIELARTIKLDTLPPMIAAMSSKVRDERGDTIEFSTGEPVHTHAGAEIELVSPGCPTVYKYAYLAGSDPVFGRQVSPNPLAWSFSLQDARIVATSYRVRDASNQVLRDWVATPPPANGSYRVELARDGANGVAELATYSGMLYVDVLARDWAGLEKTETACIDYRPLAAPLHVEPIQASTTAYAGIRPLAGMTLAADSPISVLARSGFGASIATQRIVQYTAEPIRISLASSLAGLSVSRTYVDDHVAGATSSRCSTGGCYESMPADPPDSVSSGPSTGYAHSALMVDEQTNEIVLGPIPPRGPNDPPRAYRLVYYMSQLAALQPSAGQYPSEYSHDSLTYTGLPMTAAFTACTLKGWVLVGDQLQYGCKQWTQFHRMVALDSVAMSLTGVAIDVKTSVGNAVAPMPLAHVPASVFALATVTWDGGDDDLPGAH